MTSLGAALYLIARTLPRISDESLEEPKPEPSLLLTYLEKADFRLKSVTEKFLRRCRLLILKIDNSLSRKLDSFRKENGKNNGFSLDLDTEKDLTDNTEK